MDKLLRKLDYQLEYSVIFSSVTCGKGNTGQTNYAFGNSLCKRICEQRRKDGLHGLAIQYGPVGDVGVFENSNQMLEMSTLQKQRIHSCCEVLDRLLTAKQPVITSWVRPIYIMPPIEITFSTYEEFAKKFDRPVIGLNWTQDVIKCETIKEINQYFSDLLNKLEPKGDYDMIGTLDGAIFVAKQLMKGRLRKGVIVDIIHDERYILEKVSEDVAL